MKIDNKNIMRVFKKAIKKLDEVRVENVKESRKFISSFGDGYISEQGTVIFNHWNEPIQVLRKDNL